MPYRIAGIDVHKKMLAVVVTDVEVDGDFHFDHRKTATTPADLRGLADWLVEQHVELALRVAAYAYVMDRGQIALEGRSDEVRNDPQLFRYLAP